MSKKLYNKILDALEKNIEPDVENIETLGYAKMGKSGGGSVNITAMKLGSATVSRTSLCEDTVFVPGKSEFEAAVLIIGGGAGGGTGFGGGAGGAGGYREFTKKYYSGTNYTVAIGAGGSAGSNGSDSSIERIASGGGSGGDISNSTGHDGGSGGGGGGVFAGPKGSTTSPRCNGAAQGNNGADYLSGGGGGGGGSGATTNTRDGGNGTASSITGSSTTRASGGGGGDASGGFGNTPVPGSGGSGGGGNGGTGNQSDNSSQAAGANGTVNTGSGGGGGAYYSNDSFSNLSGAGGNGGSGFVCIKYPNTKTITVGSGLTSSTATSGDYKITQITAGTDTISFSESSSGESLTIALINDGSVGYSVNVTFSLTTLPTGTTKLRYSISGTGATSSVVTISNLNSSSNVSGTGDFRCRYVIASNQGSFYHVPGDSVPNISLTVEALNASDTILATSNTLTGLKIDEDG